MAEEKKAPKSCILCGEGEPAFACSAVLYAGCERDIFTCGACGSSYYWPVPSPEDIARCYPPAYFRDFLGQYWKDYYKGRLLAEEVSAWKPAGTFLDVGCALGTMAAGFRDHSRWKVLGLEHSEAAAALGSQVNALDIARGGLAEAPWAEFSVDYLHINNVLEHEASPGRALLRAARLLAPGGRLHLTVPNGPVDLRATRDLYWKWGRAVTTRHGGHLFFFTRRALVMLLERAGLKPLAVKNFHFKTGLKARGWTPRAYRQFKREPEAHPADAPADAMTAEEFKKRVGPPPSYKRYRFGAKRRRLWRLPGLEWGYDFEIFAEKP